MVFRVYEIVFSRDVGQEDVLVIFHICSEKTAEVGEAKLNGIEHIIDVVRVSDSERGFSV